VLTKALKTMENNTENNDSPNVDNGTEATAEDTTALKEKMTELEASNRQLFERAKKAEGFEKKGEEWVKKEKTEKKSSKKSEPNEEFGLLQKGFLRSANIVDEEEVQLVKDLMAETGKEIDVLIDTKYFKSELEALQTKKKNELATSGIKTGRGETNAVNTAEHWIAKGVPPTKEQVPDRKTRAKIARAMMSSQKSSKTFYSD